MGVNVGVTGLNATDNPAPGIGVIRCLHHPDQWDGEIIGLGYGVYDTGIYDQDLLNHIYLIPYPNQGSDQLFNRLMYIREQVGLDVIIPTLDNELPVYQILETRLKEQGISLYIPNKDIFKKRSKVYLSDFCKEEGISTPETFVIREPGQLKDAINEVGFPLMIKGVFYEAYLCQNRWDVQKYYDNIRLKWGLPVIIQKVLKGEEYDVCCVCDREGNLLGAVPIRKIGLTEKGKAWSAVTLKNDRLMDLSEKIVKKLNWSGPCELEIFKEDRSDKFHLLEINPRFPAWIFLSTGAEQNLPKLVVDLALGNNVKPLPPAKSGVMFVRHATDLVCPLEYVDNLTVSGELHY